MSTQSLEIHSAISVEATDTSRESAHQREKEKVKAKRQMERERLREKERIKDKEREQAVSCVGHATKLAIGQLIAHKIRGLEM